MKSTREILVWRARSCSPRSATPRAPRALRPTRRGWRFRSGRAGLRRAALRRGAGVVSHGVPHPSAPERAGQHRQLLRRPQPPAGRHLDLRALPQRPDGRPVAAAARGDRDRPRRGTPITSRPSTCWCFRRAPRSTSMATSWAPPRCVARSRPAPARTSSRPASPAAEPSSTRPASRAAAPSPSPSTSCATARLSAASPRRCSRLPRADRSRRRRRPGGAVRRRPSWPCAAPSWCPRPTSTSRRRWCVVEPARRRWSLPPDSLLPRPRPSGHGSERDRPPPPDDPGSSRRPTASAPPSGRASPSPSPRGHGHRVLRLLQLPRRRLLPHRRAVPGRDRPDRAAATTRPSAYSYADAVDQNRLDLVHRRRRRGRGRRLHHRGGASTAPVSRSTPRRASLQVLPSLRGDGITDQRNLLEPASFSGFYVLAGKALQPLLREG
jgi:hypothetical protein